MHQAYMPPIGGNRPACAVKCTDIADPSKVHEFQSLLAAKRAMFEWHQKNVGHSLLKKYAERRQEAYGYRWEMVYQDSVEVDNDAIPACDHNVFTFRECVEGIFNGGKVRVTDETPRRASVFDVIRVVTETPNPRVTFQRLCAEYTDIVTRCYNCQFHGERQRETPVADAEGLMYIIQLLPGRRAALFRMHAAQLLVRFLAGDQSLHDEIDANAEAQAALHTSHQMQMMTDVVYANPKSRKYIMKSSRMAGKHIHQFYNKPVVYLLGFESEGKNYVKVGWSDDIRSRMEAHFKDYPNFELYSIVSMDNAYRLEKAFKERFAAYNEEVAIGGKIKTELFTGLAIEDADEGLVELYHELRLQNASDKQIELERMKLEAQLRMAEMQHAIEMKRLELEIEKARAGQ